MPYSVRDEAIPGTNEIEYVVVSRSGIPVPPPRVFRRRQDAAARATALEEQELALIAKWTATAPMLGQSCVGKVVDATIDVIIQHLGRGVHVYHWRAASEELLEVEVGDIIELRDGQLLETDRERDTGLSP